MLRDFRIADLFTLLNGFAGTGAILCFMRFCIEGRIGFFWAGTGLLPFALLMDVLDGRVARARGESSLLGQELDSLADVVSFGVAPATMAFSAGLRGEWDCVCLMFFVACGISRLARYNVTAPAMSAKTGKVPYYEGLPIPTSLLLVTLIGVLAAFGHWQEDLPLGAWTGVLGSFHPLSLVFIAHGCAMISKTLHLPKP